MKKILSIIAVVGLMFLASCGGGNNANHPIVGHRYANAVEQITFHYDGTADVWQIDEIGDWYSYPYFTYTIKGKTISVYWDNSDNVKEETRGKLANTMTYRSKDDTIESENGSIFHRVE